MSSYLLSFFRTFPCLQLSISCATLRVQLSSAPTHLMGRNIPDDSLCLPDLLLPAVVYLWWQFPGPSLAGLLAASAWHFGTNDAQGLLPGPWHWAEVAARGFGPITLPFILHREEVRPDYVLCCWISRNELAMCVGSTHISAPKLRSFCAIGFADAKRDFLRTAGKSGYEGLQVFGRISGASERF
jgi:hypothetical protein